MPPARELSRLFGSRGRLPYWRARSEECGTGALACRFFSAAEDGYPTGALAAKNVEVAPRHVSVLDGGMQGRKSHRRLLQLVAGTPARALPEILAGCLLGGACCLAAVVWRGPQRGCPPQRAPLRVGDPGFAARPAYAPAGSGTQPAPAQPTRRSTPTRTAARWGPRLWGPRRVACRRRAAAIASAPAARGNFAAFPRPLCSPSKRRGPREGPRFSPGPFPLPSYGTGTPPAPAPAPH